MLDNKNILVLYHADCMDGYAAAWAMWKFFFNKARYIPVRHQSAFPEFSEGTEIYIVDFCYPIDELLLAAQKAKKITVLDHHISAEKEIKAYQKHSKLQTNLEVKFEQNHSGCIISWQYFHKNIEAPQLLKHIEDHDLWRHQLPKTEEISKALYLRLPVKFSLFEKIKLPTLRQEGTLLVEQQHLNVSRLLNARHTVSLNNCIGMAVNAPSMFSSDLGHELAKISGNYGLTYYFHGKRQCYECSLRSIGEFDVSELASQFGGGGHQNAAGFTVDQSTFLSFYNN